MMNNSLRHKRLISVFMALMMILSLVACGGSSGGNEAGPEGAFYNTQLDEDDGKGFQPTDEYLNYGYLTFNSDGTGKWEYALDNNIEWKLKGDKLTIVEKWVDPEHGEQEETYKATWDGEKLILNHYGYLYIFEKTDGPTSPTGTESPDSNDKIVGLYDGTGSDMQGTKLDPAGEWLELMEDGRGKWFLGATEDTFTWTINGNEMSFEVDVANSDIKMPYTATIDQEEITLDTGMLYYFTKKDSVSPAEITSIEGGWKCIEMTMEEQGIITETEEIEEMNSMKADEIIQFTAYGDGTADMIFYGDEAEIVWSEENGKYVLKLSYDGVVDDSSIMDGVIEDNKLIIKMIETYTSDDKEIETIMSYIFEHQGKVSKFFKTLDFQLS
ncbi:MAG: hypothetical protein GX829_02920, partial [Clostridium sp.]|nr:hypothetical protein [Clostridium sp.]